MAYFSNIFSTCCCEQLLRWWCHKAVKSFMGDGRFTNANFAHVVMEELGLQGPPDGNIVRLMLVGRKWLVALDDCMYEMPEFCSARDNPNQENKL